MPLHRPAKTAYRRPFTMSDGDAGAIRLESIDLDLGSEPAPDALDRLPPEFADWRTRKRPTGVELIPSEALSAAEGWTLARQIQAAAGLPAEPLFEIPADFNRPLSARADGATARESFFGGGSRPPAEWALQMLEAREAWRRFGVTGKGIRIGHPDTGYTQHPEIFARDRLLVDEGVDYVDEGPPLDDMKFVVGGFPGHGTGTASVIMSGDGPAGDGSRGVTGVAPQALLVPYRVSRSVVMWSQSNLARAIEDATSAKCQVISISLGGLHSNRLERAIRRAQSHGVIVVAAAGNFVRFVVWPARYEAVVAVAACGPDGTPWFHSSRGSAVDVTAPGHLVWRAEWDGGRPEIDYGSGTSYGTAAVAGLAALWLELHKEHLADYTGPERVGAFHLTLAGAGLSPVVGGDLDDFGSGIANAVRILELDLPARASSRDVLERARTGHLARKTRPNGLVDDMRDLIDAERRSSAETRESRRPARESLPPAAVPRVPRELQPELLFHLFTDPAARRWYAGATLESSGPPPFLHSATPELARALRTPSSRPDAALANDTPRPRTTQRMKAKLARLQDELTTRFKARGTRPSLRARWLEDGGGDAMLRKLEHYKVSPRLRRAFEEGGWQRLRALSGREAFAVDRRTIERILGTNDLLPAAFVAGAAEVIRAVGRIKITAPDGTGFGTGFLVSPRLLLTNNHVLGDIATAKASSVEFDYENDAAGSPKVPTEIKFDPKNVFITSEALDYTLVALSVPPERAAYVDSLGAVRLTDEASAVVLNDRLNIVQHPNGQPKQVAIRENLVVDILNEFIHYRTDTAPGSSGAPVLDDQWRLVALHHLSVPRTRNGDWLKTDGTVWLPGDPDEDVDWIANEGVRVERIVADLREQTRSDERLAAWVQDALSTEKGTIPLVFPDRTSVPVSHGIGTQAQVTPDGRIVITLPIELSLRLPAQPGLPVLPLVTSQPPPEDPELAGALRELERSRRRKYYDAAADREDAEAYYRDIDLSDGSDLYRPLARLVRTTHRIRLGYSPSKHLYPWVDLQPDLTLRSLYSDEGMNPEEVIRVDGAAERMIREVKERLEMEGTSKRRIADELESMEEAMKLNCEHVVPQSWFGKKEPMRGDLHHLFACEPDCNSFRGNTPFFDFADSEEKVRDRCGRLEKNKFEPAAGKGTAARAVLYFLLRYEGEIDDPREYTEERLKMLLRWHRRFEVTTWERHRNAAIFEKQGNRNPFVDHPEWADLVDFGKGLG